MEPTTEALEQEIAATKSRLEALQKKAALCRRLADLRRQQKALEQQIEEAGPNHDDDAVAELRKIQVCPQPHYPPFCTQPHYPPYCTRPHTDDWNYPRRLHPWNPYIPSSPWYGHGSSSGNGDAIMLRGNTGGFDNYLIGRADNDGMTLPKA